MHHTILPIICADNSPDISQRDQGSAIPTDKDAHAIVQLLFDNLVLRLQSAEQEIDPAARAVLVVKIVAIVQSLQNSLDLERGGELAENLNALYSYMQKRLSEKGSDDFEVRLREVRDLVGILKQAWEAIQPELYEMGSSDI